MITWKDTDYGDDSHKLGRSDLTANIHGVRITAELRWFGDCWRCHEWRIFAPGLAFVSLNFRSMDRSEGTFAYDFRRDEMDAAKVAMLEDIARILGNRVHAVRQDLDVLGRVQEALRRSS